MKIYSDKIGPVEYFGFIAFVSFALPYVMGVPRFWPVCVALSVAGYFALRSVVKKAEATLREAKPDDPKVGKVVLIFAVAIIANGVLVKILQP